MSSTTSATISAQNTFTTEIQLVGYFNLSIVGSTSPAWSGTVTVQRSSNNSTWRDVDAWASVSSEEVGFEPRLMYYRVGVKTGNYSAGSVSVSLEGQRTLPYTSS